jgi:hypothetical protein
VDLIRWEEDERRPRFTSQADVTARASSLGNSVKTESFIGLSCVQKRRFEGSLRKRCGLERFQEDNDRDHDRHISPDTTKFSTLTLIIRSASYREPTSAIDIADQVRDRAWKR